MQIQYYIKEVPFHFPFTISKGTKTHQPTFVIEMEWNGLKGYGEAPSIHYYHISTDKMAADLEKYKPQISKFAITDPERFWHFLHHLIPDNQFLICALDMAAWDLYGKLMRKPLYQIWKLDIQKTPLTDYTIGIDSLDRMIEKIKLNPWPLYKVKVGFNGDVEMLEQLQQYTKATIRVDANEGWNREEAIEKIPKLMNMGIELVEQPLHKQDQEGMKILKEQFKIPLIADESCVTEQDIAACAESFHGINIKLTKCGGITPARRMIRKAKSMGLKIMLGCMNETTIGTAAMLHMAPEVDYLDADGPLLLKEDLATGLVYDQGKMELGHLTSGLSIDVAL